MQPIDQAGTPRGRPSPPAANSARADPELRSRGRRDWYRFVLGELNGLGTILRYDQRDGGAVETTAARVHEVLAALAWDPAAAREETWAFVANGVASFDDVWGPWVVLQQLEPERARVGQWLATLSPAARAVIDETPALGAPITGRAPRP